MSTSNLAPVAVAMFLVVALGGTGCGSSSAHAVKSRAAAAVPSPAHKHYAHGTGHLRISVTPSRGGVGTQVTITATGCSDADGQNHAVSFNPGFGNTMQAARAHYDQGVIPSQITAQTLRATYRITANDAAAAAQADSPPPRFYVQCSDDLADADFNITQ